MAIDPDFYERVSGRRPNDAVYGSAMLGAGRASGGEGMSFWEASNRGRRWLAIGTGLIVIGCLVYFVAAGGL